MEKNERTDITEKKPHPIAQKIETLIRKRMAEKKEELGLSDDALGERTFSPLGYNDGQKKVNNLLRGRTGMKIAEFYILCEGLELPPDRVFTAALDDALREAEAESKFSKGIPEKKEPPRTQEKDLHRPVHFTDGAGDEYYPVGR